METLWQDIRYALRTMAKNPGFVAVAVLTLALGIGANTAIFSIVNGVLLRPLPYPHPEQLVLILDIQPNYGEAPMSYPEFADWRSKSQVFQSVAAENNRTYTLSGMGLPEQVRTLRVSASYLSMFGAEPVLGRNFRADEEASTSPRVAIITDSFWRNRFGGDASVLNKTVILDNNIFSIVGVLPRNYQPLQPGDILTPLRFSDSTMNNRGLHFLLIYGRLREGLNISEARKQLGPIAEQIKKDRSSTHGVVITGVKEDLTRGTGTPLALLFGAVGFVLLIGCANVANLLLSKAAGRHREMAVRIALGAGHWRLIRQLLTESTVLSLVGGALGLVVGRFTLTGILALLGPRLPRATEVTMDGSVLLFALAVALMTGIVFGLAPARALLRTSLAASLGEGGRAGLGAGGRQRSVLVVSEVALALVLLVGAGLVLRSFSRLLSVPKGFDADHVLSFNISLPSAKYKTPVQQTEFFTELRHRVGGLPGVDSAGFVTDLPLAGGNTNGGINIEGRTFPRDSGPTAGKRITSPGYFRAMHIPILRGREFTDADVIGAPHVAIVNESFARKYFPNEDPLGKHIGFNWEMDGFQEIIGVVGDVKQGSLARPSDREVYVSYLQRPISGFTVVVRTQTEPGAIVSAIRSTLGSLDAGMPMADVATLDSIVSRSLSDDRANVFLLGSLSALALVLTAIGIYGVLAYTVAQQTRELGVRIALGASGGDVLRLVLGRGLRLVAIGSVLGLAISFGVTRVMSSILFGVTPTDPITFVGVTLLLLAVTFVACWIPARRATRIDPLTALRYE
jgi:putative ABC transport system permease protein